MSAATLKTLLVGSTLAVLFWTTVPGVLSQSAEQGAPGPITHAGSQPQMRAADRQNMMAEMKAAQTRLDELVAQMNAASGSDKIDRIAAVVTQMAGIHKRMEAMMQGGMMERMQMMPSDGDHAEHHRP